VAPEKKATPDQQNGGEQETRHDRQRVERPSAHFGASSNLAGLSARPQTF
jgi:hypothetical protein